MNTLTKTALLLAGLAFSAVALAAPTGNNLKAGQPAPGVHRYPIAQPDQQLKYHFRTYQGSQLETDRLAAAVAADLGNRLEDELELLIEKAPTFASEVITD